MTSQVAKESDQRQSILIDIEHQTLELRNEAQLIAVYPISSSRFGLGNEEGSFRTPTGRFKICKKIGDGATPWMIFQGRIPIGETARPGGQQDLVLSRILWLEGLEEENRNTRERYIYIHGTNQEDLIGTPASHGCIRLKNHEMIDLYDRVETGTEVRIKP
jgi:lipoprotein-anchoring transpeptidase ErfK/SrfK